MNCVDNNCTTSADNKTHCSSEVKSYIRTAASLLMLTLGIVATVIDSECISNQWIRLAWYILAYIPVGFPVLNQAWKTLKQKDVFNEYTLMSIATIGAFLIGEYPEAVAVMLFYSVGELFQESAVNRVRRNISALLDVRPETVYVIRGGVSEMVSPDSVQVGETVEVKPGERVPLDGILQTASALFNTSALTGESVPRTINKNEEVLAGMIAADSMIRITVDKPFGQSALARILELVQNAAKHKAPTEQFIRKFARVYTPAVVALAAFIVLFPWIYSLVSGGFIYDFDKWIYRALVFLVISCPCALVVSIPLSYFGGIGAASRNGILFKGSNYLDAIIKINSVVMDKTGTLTQGVFEVREIVPANGVSEETLLETIASVESQSTHPIAKAIVTYGEMQQVKTFSPENVKEIAGHGLEAVINSKTVLAGNTKLLIKHDIKFPSQILAIPETVVLCAIDNVYAGYILVADAPKKDAAIAVATLREMGMKNIVMLSGDKQAIVSKLAGELNISQAYGDLLPEEKVKHIELLKADTSNNIAFVGDGINDAPVLAMSDIGIAMGGLGSDVAIETADVIIQTDQPSKIATAIRIGKATRKVVIQNITFVLAVKLIVLILGASGETTLWEAVFADVGVALLAILNAARILRMKF